MLPKRKYKKVSESLDMYIKKNEVIDNFKAEEKGYFLPFKESSYVRIVNDPINDGEIAAVFEARRLLFRRICRREGGWELQTQQAQGQAERFLTDEEWPIYYYGKAVWAFQPL